MSASPSASQLQGKTQPLDHISLGRKFEIFTTDPLVGSGLPLWLPDGAAIRHELDRFILDVERMAGFQHVMTPAVGKRELYEKSGHWEFFSEDMYPPMELGEEAVVLRPVNCPHHVLIYQHAERSYRDLPLRLAELGAMYRMERSGVVAGLSRVRAMTLNDAHIFCRPDQVGEEVRATLDLVNTCYEVLGLNIQAVRLSTRNESGTKWAGPPEQWEIAESALRSVLQDRAIEWSENPGDAAFYGPKIDIDVIDVSGRSFTLSTVQVDLWMPERFDLTYVDSSANRVRPVMVHRSILSTAERLMAFLLEQTQGRFPFWLAPQQVWVLPVDADHRAAADDLVVRLLREGVRARVRGPGKSLGSRIRDASSRHIPVVAVLGDREVKDGSASVRLRGDRESIKRAQGELVAVLGRAAADRAAEVPAAVIGGG